MTPLERIALMRAEEQTAAEVERARHEGQERAKGRRICTNCGRGIFTSFARDLCGECTAKARDRARPGERTRRRERERPVRESVLVVLRRHDMVTPGDVQAEAGLSQVAAHQMLGRLVRAGLARRVGVGRYVAVRS